MHAPLALTLKQWMAMHAVHYNPVRDCNEILKKGKMYREISPLAVGFESSIGYVEGKVQKLHTCVG